MFTEMKQNPAYTVQIILSFWITLRCLWSNVLSLVLANNMSLEADM